MWFIHHVKVILILLLKNISHQKIPRHPGIAVNLQWLSTIKTLHKKWSFPLRISPVNVTKSVGNCENVLNRRKNWSCYRSSFTRNIKAEWLSNEKEPQRPNTVFSMKKNSWKRNLGLLLSVYSLSAITHTNKQTNNIFR